MYLNKIHTAWALILVITCGHVTDAEAFAFCALRDPVKAIHTLFPEADSHHSIVRSIGPDVRDSVAEKLPFTLHFNELGKHTLYVATRGAKPLGFVHVRSEPTKWGLMEIAWALNPDLSVRNLLFQRCRAPACSDAAITELRSALGGKSTTELLRLLGSDGESLTEQTKTRFASGQGLVLSAIRSALKTVTVTAIAWNKEVAEISRQLFGRYGPDSGYRFAPQAVNSDAEDALVAGLGASATMFDRTSVQLFRVGEKTQGVGWVASEIWKNHEDRGSSYWLFGQHGQAHSVRSTPRWPNLEISDPFAQLSETRFASDEACAWAAGLSGYESYFLASYGPDEDDG